MARENSFGVKGLSFEAGTFVAENTVMKAYLLADLDEETAKKCAVKIGVLHDPKWKDTDTPFYMASDDVVTTAKAHRQAAEDAIQSLLEGLLHLVPLEMTGQIWGPMTKPEICDLLDRSFNDGESRDNYKSRMQDLLRAVDDAWEPLRKMRLESLQNLHELGVKSVTAKGVIKSTVDQVIIDDYEDYVLKHTKCQVWKRGGGGRGGTDGGAGGG